MTYQVKALDANETLESVSIILDRLFANYYWITNFWIIEFLNFSHLPNMVNMDTVNSFAIDHRIIVILRDYICCPLQKSGSIYKGFKNFNRFFEIGFFFFCFVVGGWIIDYRLMWLTICIGNWHFLSTYLIIDSRRMIDIWQVIKPNNNIVYKLLESKLPKNWDWILEKFATLVRY